MSAECHKCGADIVYPEGMWPVGECPVCTVRDERDALREALIAMWQRFVLEREVLNAVDLAERALLLGGAVSVRGETR